MSGGQEVIELLSSSSSSSSDEASSSDSQPSRARRRARRSPSISSEEEEKAQLKPPRRRLVRAPGSGSSSSDRRRKRRVSSASSEGESSQEESDSSVEEREVLAQLKRPVKKAKVSVTKAYVAPATRPRPDRRADGEMRQITEGMSFYELQAQQQMMARFQNQNRRKTPPPSKPRVEHKSNISETSTGSRQLKEKVQVSTSELQAQKRAMDPFQTQNARKSAPPANRRKKAYSSASDESEEKDEEWDNFTRVSAEREALRKQKQKQKQSAVPSRTSSTVSRPRETARKSAGSGARMDDNRRCSGKQQTARKMVVAKSQEQKKAEKRGTLAIKPSNARPGTLPKQRKSRSLSSEEESEEAASDEESEESSAEESEEEEVEIIAPPRQEKSSAKKKPVSKRAESIAIPTSRQPKTSAPAGPAQTNAAESSLRSVLHGVSETQHLAEHMSFRELQEQEQALKFWRKRNGGGAPSTARKGGHGANTNGTHAATKKNGSGRRVRMGVNQKEAPDTSSPLTYISPSARNGLSAPSAHVVSTAGCTATPVQKPSTPVIHSTAWRRLVFEEAPPNILHAVSTIPYASGFDRPLWEYDPEGNLKEKCKFVAAVGQGVAITEDNLMTQPPSQLEVNSRVRELVEQELPYIKKCHDRRVRHVLRDTRKQVDGYLKAHQVLRSERYRRLQWSEIANHQSWLDISPIERVTANRVLQSLAHTRRPYNSLVGDVRYVVQHEDQPLASLVYPETVTHLPEITALCRSFTMIGVRKNPFVDDDPILRHVPYLGDGETLKIDNELYDGTTMSKARQVKVFGKGEDLKVLNPGARDDEVMEYLLRIIVRKCGASEQVFLALQHEADFDRPFVDYCEMRELYKKVQRTASKIAQVRKLIGLHQESPTDASSEAAIKALRELAHPCWFLQDKSAPHSLAVRLQEPLEGFESSYAESPEALGVRDCNTYEGLTGGHRDLLCRRCYTYDCYDHGTQNPQRSVRADPITPMVTFPGIVLARQELPVQEGGASAEDETPSSSTSPADRADIIELTGGSSSEDEVQESKQQQPSGVDSKSQPASQYRRSRRPQTLISTLASKSLETQDKMLETERLAKLEKRRKKREKFERAADKSEYVDNSYLPAVTAKLQKLVSKTQPCSSSCWLSVSNDDSTEKCAPLKQVESVLVQKLASIYGPNSCVVSAILASPRCTCAQISRFLAGEKKRRDSGDDLGLTGDLSMSSETQRKGRRHAAGVRSNRSIAKRGREKRSYDREKKESYKPCSHDGVCEEQCECVKDRHSCGRSCSCPRDCPNRFQGCNCSLGNCQLSSSCACLKAGKECDPDYCFSCGASDAAVMAFHPEFKCKSSHDLNICRNVNMLRGSIQKKIGVAFSETHGWGAYALEPIRKDDFVLEYTGELITDREAERRGTSLYERIKVSYLFGVNSQEVVDAARKGNKAKFANHKLGDPNLDVRIFSSNGEDRIGLFAREAIEVGGELFFDYGYSGDNAPKWSQRNKRPPEKLVYVDDENDEWEQMD